MILKEIVSQIDPVIHKNYPDTPLKQKYRLSVLAQRKRDRIAELGQQVDDLIRKKTMLVAKAQHIGKNVSYWEGRWEHEQTRTTRKALKKETKRADKVWSIVQDIQGDIGDLRDTIQDEEYQLQRMLGFEEDPMPRYT